MQICLCVFLCMVKSMFLCIMSTKGNSQGANESVNETFQLSPQIRRWGSCQNRIAHPYLKGRDSGVDWPSETPEHFWQDTRRHIPQHNSLHIQHHECLKPQYLSRVLYPDTYPWKKSCWLLESKAIQWGRMTDCLTQFRTKTLVKMAQ